MTIPISQVSQVIPGVLSAAGSAIDLNGLVLSQSSYAPIGAAVPFALADDVGAYFGPTSIEKQVADIYFGGVENGTKQPGLLYFAQYPSAPVAAYLRGASLASLTLTALKALTGTLIIVADGISKTSSTIVLTAATSFSNAATIIQAAFTTPGFTVTFDSLRQAFVVTSSTTGASSTMVYAAGTLAAGLALTAATGAVTSQGAVAGVPATNMDAITAVTQNWAGFMTTWEPDTAGKTAFSNWTNAQGDRFVYAGWDSDINAKTAGSTTTWGAYLKTSEVTGSIPVYGDATHAAFVLGWMASLDFDRLNGRSTLAFRQQSGLLPSATNASDASALEANGYNFYGVYANAKDQFNRFYPGAISGKWLWADTYANQIWLNANLQLAGFTIMSNVGSLPYNADGYTLVDAAYMDPIAAAVNFGAIRVGVTLSSAQKAQIKNALGVDASPALFAKGYFLQIRDATAAIRVERRSPSCTLFYNDGQSIQRLTLASIAVQ